MTVRRSTTRTISGQGSVSVAELREWLELSSPEAMVTVAKDREYNNPSDPGGTWTLTAREPS